MTIDTVLFDLDGTLIDTNELIIASFLHTIDRYAPGKYNRKDVIGWIGEPLYDSLSRIDADNIEEMMAVYREHNFANHDRLVQEYAGVYATVKTLYDHGFKLGVVTTKFYSGAAKGLTLAGLAPFFSVVVGLDDIARPKPDPEPVNRALAQLGATAERAIMIGDSTTDIEAGKEAGTQTAGVAWTIHGTDKLQAAGPDYWLTSMPDLQAILGVKRS